jgi:predicted membrane protein
MATTNPYCRQCDTEMEKSTEAERNMALRVLSVLLFLGSVLLIYVVPIGIVVGILLMLISLFFGFRKRKIWKCPNCGHYFERS